MQYFFLLFSFIICILYSCHQKQKNPDIISQKVAVRNIDSTNTIILNYDSASYMFPSTYKATTVSEGEMKIIDSLMELTVYKNYIGEQSVFPHNKKSFDSIKPVKVILKFYKRQLVFAENENGEQVVWVNCFCSGDMNNNDDNWKKEIVVVDDGGDCFFNFKINLGTKKVYDLIVNGIN